MGGGGGGGGGGDCLGSWRRAKKAAGERGKNGETVSVVGGKRKTRPRI